MIAADKKSRVGTIAAIMAVGFLLYMLSPYPVALLIEKCGSSPSDEEFYNIVYLPLEWLCRHFDPLPKFYWEYGKLWGITGVQQLDP